VDLSAPFGPASTIIVGSRATIDFLAHEVAGRTKTDTQSKLPALGKKAFSSDPGCPILSTELSSQTSFSSSVR